MTRWQKVISYVYLSIIWVNAWQLCWHHWCQTTVLLNQSSHRGERSNRLPILELLRVCACVNNVRTEFECVPFLPFSINPKIVEVYFVCILYVTRLKLWSTSSLFLPRNSHSDRKCLSVKPCVFTYILRVNKSKCQNHTKKVLSLLKLAAISCRQTVFLHLLPNYISVLPHAGS